MPKVCIRSREALICFTDLFDVLLIWLKHFEYYEAALDPAWDPEEKDALESLEPPLKY